MKIDRRFEEALGVGPRFIMKGVYAHFGLTGCVNRNKFAHCKKAQEKAVCVHDFLRERPLESQRVLFSSFGFIGTTENKPLQNNKQYTK